MPTTKIRLGQTQTVAEHQPAFGANPPKRGRAHLERSPPDRCTLGAGIGRLWAGPDPNQLDSAEFGDGCDRSWAAYGEQSRAELVESKAGLVHIWAGSACVVAASTNVAPGSANFGQGSSKCGPGRPHSGLSSAVFLGGVGSTERGLGSSTLGLGSTNLGLGGNNVGRV